ncbi:MAG: type II 3-dehydroquinate dehydratase [Candidatus Omnitrophica bacterium]|nr:type II 3-dehydroquinate dehydratase [Candidatus Omnitrophota bacterium]
MKRRNKIKILVIHGPNLNLLGKREPHIYGVATLSNINTALKKLAEKEKIYLKIIQSNYEGKIIEAIHNAAKDKFHGIIINPAAYTHTSIAIRDALSSVNLPTIEVHLSNIYCREEFRRYSLISAVAIGQICGFGPNSYLLGLKAILDLLRKNKE